MHTSHFTLHTGHYTTHTINTRVVSSSHMNCSNTVYVSLSDPESMKCSHILEQSPWDSETTIRPNVVLTVFPTQNICHHAWKTLRTKLWCFVYLQSRGEGLKSKENYGTDLYQFFSILWPFSHNWRPIMHCDVVLTVFHTWWNVVKTTLWHIVDSQTRGDCSKMWWNCMDPGSESETYATFLEAPEKSTFHQKKPFSCCFSRARPIGWWVCASVCPSVPSPVIQ